MAGSSRGNPGHSSVGGIGRDKIGNVKFFFSIYKGFYTNNFMEALAILYVVDRGCVIGWKQIIYEFDS